MNDFVGYIDSEGNIFDGTFDYEGRVGPIGPQGPQGYTPQRGVDYWTDEDKAYVVAEATSLIDGKIEEYNANATAKTNAFNQNASDKTTAFNSNATNKTNDFNSNATSKTTDFNNNASSKTSDFDDYVGEEFDELTGSFYTKNQMDDKLASTYYTKSQVNNIANAKQDVIAETINRDIVLTDGTEPTTGFDGQRYYTGEHLVEYNGNAVVDYNCFFYGMTIGQDYVLYSVSDTGHNVTIAYYSNGVWDITRKDYIFTSDIASSIASTSTNLKPAGAKAVYDFVSGALGKQIQVLGDEIPNLIYLDENYKGTATYKITEGIYYNTKSALQMITSYAGTSPRYTSIQTGAILIICPKGTSGTKTYYKYVIIYPNTIATHPEIKMGISTVTTFAGSAVSFVNTEATPEYTENKVTSISSSSTNTQYPSAKLLYDQLALRDEAIEELQAENEQLLSQIPTATATGETIHVEDSSNLPPKDFAMSGNATQADTPTPEAPQDIHVVTGDNIVKLLGKNLFDTSNYTIINSASLSITRNDDGSFTINGTNTENAVIAFYNNIFLNGSYTIITKEQSSNNGYFNLYENINLTGAIAYANISSTSHFSNFSYTGKSISQRLLFNPGTYNNLRITPMLVYGTYNLSNIGEFEPYITPQTQLLSLGSIKLAKIGDYIDRPFKAQVGLKFYDSLPDSIKANLTLGKWYVWKNNNKVTLNGSENWSKSSNTSVDRFVLGNSLHQVDINSLCNLFQTVERGTTTVGTWYNNTGTQLIFNYTAYGTTTLEQWKTWLASNNIIIYQPLKTPTTTEITDTTLISQLEAILAMHTNKNVTNAWIEPSGTNAQASLTLTYYRDLQTLTDKIDNLEARVSLLE